MSMSNYLENALINATLRNTAFTSPAAVYVALHTADPGETGATAEVSGGSYARTAATFGTPSDGVSSNTGAVTFPTATGSWGTVTHFSIWDAASGGNCLYVGNAVSNPQTVTTGGTPSFAAGALSVTLT